MDQTLDAISWGVDLRLLVAIRFISAVWAVSSSPLIMSVPLTNPGAIVFTRIPQLETSCDSTFE